MEETQYSKACAIGMADFDDYTHEAFIEKCKDYPQLIPIAGFNPLKSRSLRMELAQIAKLGFKGIKIHPRFSGIKVQEYDLAPVLQLAGKFGLVVFYCTYMHCGLPHYPTSDPFYSLVRWLQQAPDTKVVLVHGGDVQVLRYAELVRFNPNLMLDLSLTLMKYPGSSVDADIRFLFRYFDRRICIGSDFPEYSLAAVRQRFEEFAEGVSLEKKENIAFGNLSRFLGF